MDRPGSPLSGKTCVVTGATSGIGKVIATELAARGGHVVLAGRDASRVRQVRTEVRAAARSNLVEGVVADLSLVSGVRRLTRELVEQFPRLDLLVNNAGAIFTRRVQTPEGTESTWALNVVAPFLLTKGLRGSLGAADGARVVMIASEAHRGARLDFDDLEGQRRLSGLSRYQASKLALILLTHEFARRWSGTGIAVNAVHPGLVRTRFGLNNPGAGRLLFRIAMLVGISPEHGARTPLWVATDPGLRGVSGAYFLHGREGFSSAASYDGPSAQRLWSELERRFPDPPTPGPSGPEGLDRS